MSTIDTNISATAQGDTGGLSGPGEDRFTTRAFTLDPLRDPRWSRFVESHSRASVFHTFGWLDALRRTYGYYPLVVTTTPETEELTNGLVLCRVTSPLTGSRLVSVPFSDHCEPLVESSSQWRCLVVSVIETARSKHCKYVEFRVPEGLAGDVERLKADRSYYLDTLDISGDAEDLFRSFSRKAVQQPIKRAERENLSCAEGRSPALLRDFYGLLLRTRRRHGVPPQPLKWFENLVECMGNRATIRVASKGGRPIASIITLSFHQNVYYKYGCSDERFNNLGGIQLLLWRAIAAEKERNAAVLDMGRSDMDQIGLLNFKERWGSTRTVLTYYRYPSPRTPHTRSRWAEKALSYAFARVPDFVLTTIGKLLYRHVG
jgi:CelD/BcsL family acetyltransferase involved in cellulose biosynthesis